MADARASAQSVALLAIVISGAAVGALVAAFVAGQIARRDVPDAPAGSDVFAQLEADLDRGVAGLEADSAVWTFGMIGGVGGAAVAGLIINSRRKAPPACPRR